MKKNSPFIFRAIQTSDAKSLFNLSKEAQAGMSNLPKSMKDVDSLIETSLLSFKNKTIKNKKYIFVIEFEQEIIGVSGIKTTVGVERPYYSFLLNNNVRHPYLELIQQQLGPSEIGSLFLSKHFRSKGIGRLLSLSRFLFIK